MPGDAAELRVRAAAEPNALRRDRYRAVLLAIDGREARDIAAAAIGRARRSVQDWAYAYRDGGVDAVQPKRRVGRIARLSPELEARLKARLDAGPLPADGVCTLRGRDVVRILEREFGVRHTLGSICGVLARIGYSCLAPRPRHEKNDPEAIAAFRADAPFFVFLIMDQAGWHRSKSLALPDCVTVLLLPPYSPELNPVENRWHHLCSHQLRNRAYDDYDHLIDAGTEAWRRLTPEVIRSVCRCPYLERAQQS